MSRTEESAWTDAALTSSQSGPHEFKFQPGQRVGGGRFRLEQLIGRGGMGTVWQAFDERLKESVALKFISERIRGNATALDSMRRETSRSHSLSHQHIVRVHDLYEGIDEPAFISMEYVPGKNLQELARNQPGRAFGLEDVWRWTRQLCAALGYAHSRGVIHRDLKPANLMLDHVGEIKLADFGLAAALRDPGSEGQSVSGTPAYMSPQQFAGAAAAVTDDIYSLAACVFELLSGAPVFKGPELRRQIELEPAPLLSSAMRKHGLAREVPEGFEDLISRCLSKNPQNRPQSAKAFLEAAEEALAHAGEASDVATAERPPAPAGRSHRWLWLAATAALAALCAAFALRERFSAQYYGPFLDLRKAPVRSSTFALESIPEGAFDGFHRHYDVQNSNRWASATILGDASEWITVDLGQDMRIRAVVIDWELAYAKDFTIRTRTSREGWTNDPSLWSQRAKVAGFKEKYHGAVNAITNVADVAFDFKRSEVHLGDWMEADQAKIETVPFVARHLMVHATARGLNNPGVYSIQEIQVSAQPDR